MAFIHQSQTGVLTFELPALMHTHFSGTAGVLLFLAFTAAFAVKAPLFPFHTWSPDAYAQAPTAGSVILAAVMAKLGTYGIIRFDLNLFPQATRTLAPILLTLAVIGILYGAIVACVQKDMKRLVAYSSLAHIGFIVLGTFALTTQAAHRWRPPDGQSRLDHRRHVHPHRLDLRAPQDMAGEPAPRAAVARSGDGRRLHRLRHGLHRTAGPERLRG